MSVKSEQAITRIFTTQHPATKAPTDADATPTGTLYVNGTANAAAVTVTNITTGVYKAAVTLPALSAGDSVDLRIAATVAAATGTEVVWADTADTVRLSDGVTLAATQTAYAPSKAGDAMTLTAAYDHAKDDVLTPLAVVDGLVGDIEARILSLFDGTGVLYFKKLIAVTDDGDAFVLLSTDADGVGLRAQGTNAGVVGVGTNFGIAGFGSGAVSVGLYGESPHAGIEGKGTEYGIVARADGTDETNSAMLLIAYDAEGNARALTVSGDSVMAGRTVADVIAILRGDNTTLANAVGVVDGKADTLMGRNEALTAAGTRAALGMAAADLDDQMDAIASAVAALPDAPVGTRIDQTSEDASGAVLGLNTPGSSITAYLASDTERTYPKRHTTAATDGTWALYLPAGTYVLVAALDGYYDAADGDSVIERTVVVP